VCAATNNGAAIVARPLPRADVVLAVHSFANREPSGSVTRRQYLFTLALYLQQGLGKSAAYSGLALVSWVAAFGIPGPVLGRFPARARALAAAAGAVLLAAGFAAALLASEPGAALLASEPGARNVELYPVFVGADVDFIIGGEVSRVPDFRPRLKRCSP
jgi:hypothetical protein